MAGYDGFEPTADLQASVRRDLQRILEYGEHHRGEFGGKWLEDQHNYGVSFTRSVQHNEVALAAQLELPERLRVRQCSYSEAQLREVQTVVVDEEMKRPSVVVLAGTDLKQNVVRVGVLSGHTYVERRLRGRFGSIIAIERGQVARVL